VKCRRLFPPSHSLPLSHPPLTDFSSLSPLCPLCPRRLLPSEPADVLDRLFYIALHSLLHLYLCWTRATAALNSLLPLAFHPTAQDSEPWPWPWTRQTQDSTLTYPLPSPPSSLDHGLHQDCKGRAGPNRDCSLPHLASPRPSVPMACSPLSQCRLFDCHAAIGQCRPTRKGTVDVHWNVASDGSSPDLFPSRQGDLGRGGFFVFLCAWLDELPIVLETTAQACSF